MRSYRLAQAVVWEMLTTELASEAGDRDELREAVQICSSLMFAFVDAALVMADEAYAAERERWHRSAAAAQAEAIEAILAGRLADAGTAGRRLRYELDREHLVVAAWVDAAGDDQDSLEALEAAVAQLASAIGSDGTLVQPVGAHALVAWLSARSRIDRSLLDTLRIDTSTAPAVVAAIGEPGHGIDGFRSSHEEAGHARRLATLTRRVPGSVTRYGDVALQAMATADPDQARAFVRRTLGELAAGDDTSLRLAATLRAYLDEHASRSRAAKRLGVHENTISYRIRQAEEILDRSVEDDTLDLRVALALAPVLR
jgi:DNA-binding PucR family transcriptional regulator